MSNGQATSEDSVGYFTLTGEVNSDMVRRVFDAIELFSTEQLRTAHILIQSNGGYVSDGICLYNTLRNTPINLVMYNAGAIASIGVIVFLAGDARVAADTARFMLHKSQASASSGAGPEALRIIADGLLADDRRTQTILQRHLGLTAEMWNVHSSADLHLTAEEALTVDLINSIGNFSPPDNARVRTI